MYTLRHPSERAAALHLPPAKDAKGLEGGTFTWAGEEGVLVVEHDEVEEDDEEDDEG